MSYFKECDSLNDTLYYNYDIKQDYIDKIIDSLGVRKIFFQHKSKNLHEFQPLGSLYYEVGDSIELSKAELLYLMESLKKNQVISFDTSKCRFLTRNEYLELQKSENGVNICKTLFSFLSPIYIRDKRYCIFIFQRLDFFGSEFGAWIYKSTGNNFYPFSPIFRIFELPIDETIN